MRLKRQNLNPVLLGFIDLGRLFDFNRDDYTAYLPRIFTKKFQILNNFFASSVGIW